MRYYSLLPLFFLLTLLGSCKQDRDIVVPKDLFGIDWLRTSNQDAAGYSTYRPSALVPPNLGHEGFRFESNGTFIQYRPAPSDGTISLPGTWTTVDGQTFHITLTNAQSPPYDLLVELVDSTTLRAR